MRLIVTVISIALFAGPALGQTFNIDMENPSAAWGSGVPATSFGGAANRPGYWNSIMEMSHSYLLLDKNGVLTSVILGSSGVAGNFSHNHPQAGGDYAKLMEDGFLVPTQDVSLFFNLNGLMAGKYFVYVYCALTDYGDEAETFTHILPFLGNDNVVGGYPYEDNTFYEDTTHHRYILNLPNGGNTSIRISSRPINASAQGVIVGMQIQKLPERIYVRADAPAGGDGESWATAFNDLQMAFDQAQEWDGEVNEIWVAHGAYYPTTGTDQYASFRLLSGFANLYGGFAGNETSLDQRNPSANPTILSGNIGGPLPNDNSNSVVQVSDGYQSDNSIVLDGFTIMSGSGGYSSGDLGRGAGLQLYGADLTLRDCRFISNEAAEGAALFAYEGTLKVIDCEFLNNHAADGGGVYSNIAVESNPEPVAKFINCRFHNNDTMGRGGVFNVGSGTTTVVNSVFTGNGSYMDGGAIRASGSQTSVTLLNCSIVGNSASSIGGGAGGGLSVDLGATATLVNTILWDNHASSNYNETLQSQLSWSGGSLTANYTTVQHYFSLVLPGTANSGANPQFVNADGGDGYGGLNDNVRLAAGSPAIDSGSNLGIGQDWGDLDGDSDLNEITPLDLDFNPRRVNDPGATDVGYGFGALVDRGAFERQAVPSLMGDMDCNGIVDMSDVPAMVLALTNMTQYNQSFGCAENGDFASDDTLNGKDLQGFVNTLAP